MESSNQNEQFMYIQVLADNKGKLRLRIVNASGFRSDLNCQGPKSIRTEGSVYLLKNPIVSIVQKPGTKPFYKLPNNINLYQIVSNNKNAITKEDLKSMGYKIYEEEQCVICLDSVPSIIIKPCLHSVLCLSCFNHLDVKKCPMCRNCIKEFILVENNQSQE